MCIFAVVSALRLRPLTDRLPDLLADLSVSRSCPIVDRADAGARTLLGADNGAQATLAAAAPAVQSAAAAPAASETLLLPAPTSLGKQALGDDVGHGARKMPRLEDALTPEEKNATDRSAKVIEELQNIKDGMAAAIAKEDYDAAAQISSRESNLLESINAWKDELDQMKNKVRHATDRVRILPH